MTCPPGKIPIKYHCRKARAKKAMKARLKSIVKKAMKTMKRAAPSEGDSMYDLRSRRPAKRSRSS